MSDAKRQNANKRAGKIKNKSNLHQKGLLQNGEKSLCTGEQYAETEWEVNKILINSHIVYVLRDLVPFVQFKKCEKHSWTSVTFSKVAGCKPAT